MYLPFFCVFRVILAHADLHQPFGVKVVTVHTLSNEKISRPASTPSKAPSIQHDI
jgi:hypothetical protein